MKLLLLVVSALFLGGCQHGSPDHISATGLVTRFVPASGEGKAYKPAIFDLRVERPGKRRGLTLSYGVFAASIEDGQALTNLPTIAGKMIRIRLLKSDLTESSPESLFLRTPTSLDIRVLN